MHLLILLICTVSTAYSLLTNPTYGKVSITVLDQWPSNSPSDASGITPASIDNSRIIRPDYASKPYAQLAARAQSLWRSGWPHTLPSSSPPSSTQGRFLQYPYRESGLLLTCWTRENQGGTSALPLNPSGASYISESLRNVQHISTNDAGMSGKIRPLPSRDDVTAALGTAHTCGDQGYLNEASGWADAGAAMALLRARTKTLMEERAQMPINAPVTFLEGPAAQVSALTFTDGDAEDSRRRVTGVQLASGSVLGADLVVMAAGAWSASLLPRSLGKRIRATGQVVGYVALSGEEARKLADMPVTLNLSTGLFAFPPIPERGGGWSFKVAWHAWGYENMVTVTDVEAGQGKVDVHLPAAGSGAVVGREGAESLRLFLHDLGLGEKKWKATRTCWYADSATGDFLIDYVPDYAADSLFVATGDSGHGFKFAPVLGNCIVKAIERRLDGPGQDEELGTLLKESWKWRGDEEDAANWLGGGDGSRGGLRGLKWDEEIAKGTVGAEEGWSAGAE